MKSYSVPIHFGILFLAVLVSSTQADADTCVKYHKRAPLKAVCGRVINVAGEKLSDVEFSLTDDKGAVLYTTKSDTKGRFRFESVRKGNYILHATAAGYQATQRDVQVTRETNRKCSPKVEVTLGLSVCSTGTYVKGVDKPSDLDADFQTRQ
jgi:uncharacterized surface anchored protein